MSKAHIISLHAGETTVFPLMDYHQFDEDVCHTLSDGVSAKWGTVTSVISCFELPPHAVPQYSVCTQEHPEQTRKQINDEDK